MQRRNIIAKAGSFAGFFVAMIKNVRFLGTYVIKSIIFVVQ